MVTPGFIDCHFHIIDVNAAGGADPINLRFVTTQKGFADRVAKYSVNKPEGTWIFGEGWDERKWGGELPSKEWIDHVTLHNPVWLTRAFGGVGLQIQVHAGGYHTLKIYERIHDEMHLPDSRFRIEHAHDVPPDWILLYAKAGVIASIQPPLLSHIDIRTANGAPAPQNLFPCRRLLDAGVKIVMGTDAIGASPLTSTFEVIQTALTRPGPDGRVLTLEQCLRAYTLDAAYAEFGEKEKGSIEPGKLADLVLLDRDIFSSPVSTLDQTKVRMTVLGGRIAYSREDQISY